MLVSKILIFPGQICVGISDLPQSYFKMLPLIHSPAQYSTKRAEYEHLYHVTAFVKVDK